MPHRLPNDWPFPWAQLRQQQGMGSLAPAPSLGASSTKDLLRQGVLGSPTLTPPYPKKPFKGFLGTV